MTSDLKMLPEAVRDVGHSFSLYRPPSRHIKYMYYFSVQICTILHGQAVATQPDFISSVCHLTDIKEF